MSAEEKRAEAKRTRGDGLEEIRSPSQWSTIIDFSEGDHNYANLHENKARNQESMELQVLNWKDQTYSRSAIRSRYLDGAHMTHVLRNFGMNPENPFPSNQPTTLMPLTFTKEVADTDAEKDTTTGSTRSRPLRTETRQSKNSTQDHETGTCHQKQLSSEREHRNQNRNQNPQRSSSSIRQHGSSQDHSHGHGHGNEQRRLSQNYHPKPSDHKYASSSSFRPSNHHSTPDYHGRNVFHQHNSKDRDQWSRPNSSKVVATSASSTKAPMAINGNQANSPMMWKIRRVLKNTEGWLCPHCNGRFVNKTYRDTHRLTQKCQQIVELITDRLKSISNAEFPETSSDHLALKGKSKSWNPLDSHSTYKEPKQSEYGSSDSRYWGRDRFRSPSNFDGSRGRGGGRSGRGNYGSRGGYGSTMGSTIGRGGSSFRGDRGQRGGCQQVSFDDNEDWGARSATDQAPSPAPPHRLIPTTEVSSEEDLDTWDTPLSPCNLTPEDSWARSPEISSDKPVDGYGSPVPSPGNSNNAEKREDDVYDWSRDPMFNHCPGGSHKKRATVDNGFRLNSIRGRVNGRENEGGGGGGGGGLDGFDFNHSCSTDSCKNDDEDDEWA